MWLDRLVGTWDISLRHVAVDEAVTGRQTCERVHDEAFVLLRVSYDHPDFPDAIALLEPDRYHYFDVRGITRLFDVSGSDTGWSMVRRDSDFWQRSAVEFAGDGSMLGTGENSHDGGATWQHDFSITCTRVV